MINGLGGVFLSLSTEGLRWSRPLRVVKGEVLAGGRTTVFPVDVQPEPPDEPPSAIMPDATGAAVVTLVVQRVDLRQYPYINSTEQNRACVGPRKPRYEVLQVDIQPLLLELGAQGNLSAAQGASDEGPVSCSPHEMLSRGH